MQQQQAAHLRHRLEDEHRRHDRVPGEMALEERLVDGDVLHALDEVPLVERRDAVHQQERIAVRQEVEDRGDVPLVRRPAGAPPRQRQRLLEALHERHVALVARAHGADVPEHGGAEQEQVAQQVEHLVAHELVREAQRLGIQDAVLADHDRALEPAALDPAGAAQRLEVALEHEGARRSDLPQEGLRVDVQRQALRAHERVVVDDREAQAAAVERHRGQLDVALLPAHGLRDLDVPPGPGLGLEPGGEQRLRDGQGAAVGRLRDLHVVGLDHQVVEAEPGHRREHVLHAVDLHAVLLEDGPPPGLRVERGVLGAHVAPRASPAGRCGRSARPSSPARGGTSCGPARRCAGRPLPG